jgi:O-methyltransferase involved in polyketide biosynthesis
MVSRSTGKKIHLEGVPETLLIPLWARAVECQRQRPIIRDRKSLRILKKIDYDFSRFRNAQLSQTGISIRTKIVDGAVAAFFNRHPDAVILNLGAGLDTRFERIDNGKMIWYELDLPEVIAFKRLFFRETDRYRFIARSILDFSWLDEVSGTARPVLIIAEGLFMYFEEKDVRRVFDHLADRFPGAEMLFEMLAFFALGRGRYHDCLSRVKSKNIEFKWALKESRDMETWNGRIRLIDEWNVLDYFAHRWGWLMFLNGYMKSMIGNRIVHVRFS